MHETMDPITGLPLRGRLDDAFASAIMDRRPVSIAMVNVDRLGVINHRDGYGVGDDVLRQVGALITRSLSAEDTVSRIGGDRFAIVLTNTPGDAGRVVAERIRRAVDDDDIVAQPGAGSPGALTEEVSLHVTVSIGVVPEVPHTTELTAALAQADAAARVAKDSGRNRLMMASATAADQAAHLEFASVLQSVTSAVDDEAFVLHSQTIHPLGGYDYPPAEELLIRLSADSDLLVGPDAFVPVAEENNLIHRIDLWVLHQLRTHLTNELERRDVDPKELGRFFVNVSPRSITTKGFMEEVSDLLLDMPINPGQIVFELTETAAVERFDRVQRFTAAMHEMGSLVALDDFGSGTSSLGHLRELPVDFLKIDGSLTRGVATDPAARTLMIAIGTIAAVRNITTIAEHVETVEEARVLEELGIHMAQGYHLSRPQPLGEPSTPAP